MKKVSKVLSVVLALCIALIGGIPVVAAGSSDMIVYSDNFDSYMEGDRPSGVTIVEKDVVVRIKRIGNDGVLEFVEPGIVRTGQQTRIHVKPINLSGARKLTISFSTKSNGATAAFRLHTGNGVGVLWGKKSNNWTEVVISVDLFENVFSIQENGKTIKENETIEGLGKEVVAQFCGTFLENESSGDSVCFDDIVIALTTEQKAAFQDERCGENLWCTLSEDGILTISGSGAMYDGISEEYPWELYMGIIRKIVIEEGVSTIGSSAFSGSNVFEVELPSTLKSIDSHAFAGCLNLTELRLPEGLENLHWLALWGCTNITTIYVPPAFAERSFALEGGREPNIICYELVSQKEIVLMIGKREVVVFGETKISDAVPQLVNGRTMLPIRIVAEALDAEVIWSEEAPDKVVIKNGETTIELTIGAAVAFVNGEEIELDSPSFIENDRTYMPLRFISEALGAKVDWDEATQKVTIRK